MSIKVGHILTSLLLAIFLMTPSFALAQATQSLSVTPPLFQLSIEPGDIWQSSIKVVNNNNYELTVYAEVVNFAAQGEKGQGRFIPIMRDEGAPTAATLAEWITLNAGPYTIPPEQTRDVSFFVEIPEDAPPGGHFAAILISTEPTGKTDGPYVSTSQVVTSLFFVRIGGDIREEGSIREFTTDRSFIETPETNFKLRFENKGNVHLQPRGDIVITNMWGKERGIIPINNQTHYGNVLPESIREFDFSWKGQPSITDIGRYKAIVTLAYGEDGIKSVTNTTYFWVLPFKATLITLLSLGLVVLFLSWAIKRYVRHMLMLAGIDPDVAKRAPRASRMTELQNDVRLTSYSTITAPIRKGSKEFTDALKHVHKMTDRLRTILEFVKRYRIFFLGVLGVVLTIAAITLFMLDAARDKRSYEVTIDKGDGEVTVDSEEIIKERLSEARSAAETPPFPLVVVNASGEPGAAASAAVILEKAGFMTTSLETSDDISRSRTVVIYEPALIAEAKQQSELLGGALLSARPPSDETKGITIMIGKDQLE